MPKETYKSVQQRALLAERRLKLAEETVAARDKERGELLEKVDYLNNRMIDVEAIAVHRQTLLKAADDAGLKLTDELKQLNENLKTVLGQLEYQKSLAERNKRLYETKLDQYSEASLALAKTTGDVSRLHERNLSLERENAIQSGYIQRANEDETVRALGPVAVLEHRSHRLGPINTLPLSGTIYGETVNRHGY